MVIDQYFLNSLNKTIKSLCNSPKPPKSFLILTFIYCNLTSFHHSFGMKILKSLFSPIRIVLQSPNSINI